MRRWIGKGMIVWEGRVEGEEEKGKRSGRGG
jgi:hypothetical protein